MNENEKRRITFALRLAASLKGRAKLLADQDGLSQTLLGQMSNGADSGH